MKILVINSDALYVKNNNFSIHKSTGDFLLNLRRKGFKVSIFHFSLFLKDVSIANYKINPDLIKIASIKRRGSKPLSYLISIFKLFKLIKGSDSLYLFYPNAFSFSVLIALFFNKPFAVYLRGENNIDSFFSKFIYQRARFVTTISPHFTNLVNAMGGNGITIKPMIQFDLEDIVPNRVNFSKKRYNLLFIGRVEREKGIFELIESLFELKKVGVLNFHLNIVGHGKHFEEIKCKISEYDLNSFISFKGVITDKNDIKSLFINADFFVFPTYHEGFPRVLYEAMIFDTPILTTFVGSISYLMVDKFNCYKIEEKSVRSIVNTLKPLLLNYELTSNIAKQGTLTIKEYIKVNNFNHEDIIFNNLFVKNGSIN